MDMYAQMIATARSAEITIIPKTRQYQLLAEAFGRSALKTALIVKK